jgi:hypothetical protein
MRLASRVLIPYWAIVDLMTLSFGVPAFFRPLAKSSALRSRLRFLPQLRGDY